MNLYSMTGYGNNTISNEEFSVKVELKSVNNRYIDINIRLPKVLFPIEDKIRKTIRERVNRGKIDVFINLDFLNSTNTSITVDLNLAREYYKALSTIKNELEIDSSISLKDIYSFDSVLVQSSEEQDLTILENLVMESLEGALNNFLNMRKVEGDNIKKTFEERILYIKNVASILQERAPIALNQNLEKLKATINENVEAEKLDIQRLTTEIAIMADKLSIDEEITRVFIHLGQFNDIINLEEPIGRKLDFLVQELNREVNTIGSKSNDVKILNMVVELKSEIEKLREQIQNIE